MKIMSNRSDAFFLAMTVIKTIVERVHYYSYSVCKGGHWTPQSPHLLGPPPGFPKVWGTLVTVDAAE